MFSFINLVSEYCLDEKSVLLKFGEELEISLEEPFKDRSVLGVQLFFFWKSSKFVLGIFDEKNKVISFFSRLYCELSLMLNISSKLEIFGNSQLIK